MKIKISNICYHCLKENGNDAASYQSMYKELERKDELDIKIELNSDNIYFIECKNGHKNVLRLQAENFEILFDVAALALNDGYSKESFTTMYSAYERFVEYCIKVICHSQSASDKEFKNTWKLMAKQSERQIGAFYILQLLEFGSSKYSIPQKWIEVRNDIIHKGHIPESKKVIEFGNFLMNLMQSTLLELNSKYPQSLKLVNTVWLKPDNKSYETSDIYSSSSIPTILSLREINANDYGSGTFDEALESIKDNGFYKNFYTKN